MVWPWQRFRREAAKANLQAANAESQKQFAELRVENALALARQSRASTNSLKRQIDLNGWTELLQSAWAGRAKHEGDHSSVQSDPVVDCVSLLWRSR